jgi:hypothetical protein
VALGVQAQVLGSETLFDFGDDQPCMAASKDVVVWTARRGAGRTLAGFDRTSSHAIARLSAAAVPTDPAVGDDVVVWLDDRRGNGAPAVYGLDLRRGREFAIALDQGLKSDLSIDGDLVYWSHTNGSGRVALYGVRLARPPDGVGVVPL